MHIEPDYRDCQVHPEGCCIAGRSSALNEVVKRRHGKDAMLKASDILTM